MDAEQWRTAVGAGSFSVSAGGVGDDSLRTHPLIRFKMFLSCPVFRNITTDVTAHARMLHHIVQGRRACVGAGRLISAFCHHPFVE